MPTPSAALRPPVPPAPHPPRPVRVLLVVRSLAYAGTERQVVALARGLHARGHRVAVLTCYPGGGQEEELRAAGVRVLTLAKRGRWDVAFALRAAAVFRREAPEVVYGFNALGNLLALAARAAPRRPRVLWGVRSSFMDWRQYDRGARFSFEAARRLSPLADMVVYNSEAGRAYHVGVGYPAARAAVVPNGIDTSRFRIDPEARARVRAEWDVGPDEPVVGIVGRIDPMKDHATFLRAAALLWAQVPEARFVCVGGGPPALRERLESLAAELGLAGRVRWEAARTDVPDVYNAFDALASSSRGEGFPNVVGEAMACGVPCAVTDVGDSALVVGELGWVVAPEDPPALCAALRGCLRAGSAAEARARRERIRNTFSVEQMLVQSERAFARVLGREAGG